MSGTHQGHRMTTEPSPTSYSTQFQSLPHTSGTPGVTGVMSQTGWWVGANPDCFSTLISTKTQSRKSSGTCALPQKDPQNAAREPWTWNLRFNDVSQGVVFFVDGEQTGIGHLGVLVNGDRSESPNPSILTFWRPKLKETWVNNRKTDFKTVSWFKQCISYYMQPPPHLPTFPFLYHFFHPVKLRWRSCSHVYVVRHTCNTPKKSLLQSRHM